MRSVGDRGHAVRDGRDWKCFWKMRQLGLDGTLGLELAYYIYIYIEILDIKYSIVYIDIGRLQARVTKKEM